MEPSFQMLREKGIDEAALEITVEQKFVNARVFSAIKKDHNLYIVRRLECHGMTNELLVAMCSCGIGGRGTK